MTFELIGNGNPSFDTRPQAQVARLLVCQECQEFILLQSGGSLHIQAPIAQFHLSFFQAS